VFDDFAGFNQRVAVPGGFRLPNTAAERLWNTATQRANFFVHPLHDRAPEGGQQATLTLTTIRSHDQYNTTVYGFHDRYRGVHGERRVLFIHPDDIAALGLEAGTVVDLTSVHGDERRSVSGFRLVPYDIPRGCVAAYYPETNPLVPLSSVAEGAGTPTSKAVPVLVTRS
jgi:anaerobic selenocysteine-containing dehydrogenase